MAKTHNNWLAAAAVVCISAAPLYSQRVEFHEAAPLELPGISDSNSPVLWRNGHIQIYSSDGKPRVSIGPGIEGPFETYDVVIDQDEHRPMWIESVWEDEDGRVFGWYHHEQVGVCAGSKLTTPKIGALVSYDGGMSFRDLGIVIDSGEPVNCAAENGYFANGHGDFTVVLDRERQYFYFFFGAYAGETANQGVAAARMAFADREYPIGAVKKYFEGRWDEPALGGRVTPIFSATVGWERPDTDSFWGPSVHWNTHLQKWVMLLNRACCQPGWPQEAVFISIALDLSDPASWQPPVQLIGSGNWYPQIIGLGPGETDREAGQRVRLFIQGESDWELVFLNEGEIAEPPIL